MTDQIARGEVEFDDAMHEHRIRGYVPHAQRRGLDPNLDVPLISHVIGNLWQGGCMDGVCLPPSFKYVVSLYPWEQYVLAPDTERVEIEMYDSLEQGMEAVDEAAEQVRQFMKQGKTLVHCQAGLNRSGLVAARALILDGLTPAVAIALLRDHRSKLVLCNETFENWLLGR
jgi:hypothetical protein